MFNLIEGKKPYTGNIYSFYGLDRKRKGADGEFEDMYNMSSDEYPCLSPRKARKKAFDVPGTIAAAAAPDPVNVSEMTGFTGIAGGSFYYNGAKKNGASFADTYSWEIVRMGNLYIINGFRKTVGIKAIFRSPFTGSRRYISGREQMIIYNDAQRFVKSGHISAPKSGC